MPAETWLHALPCGRQVPVHRNRSVVGGWRRRAGGDFASSLALWAPSLSTSPGAHIERLQFIPRRRNGYGERRMRARWNGNQSAFDLLTQLKWTYIDTREVRITLVETIGYTCSAL